MDIDHLSPHHLPPGSDSSLWLLYPSPEDVVFDYANANAYVSSHHVSAEQGYQVCLLCPVLCRRQYPLTQTEIL